MEQSAKDVNPVIEVLLDRYELYARAAGYSRAQINTMRNNVRLFDRFLGGIQDIKNVTDIDFRRFQADLRERPLWQGRNIEQQRGLSRTTINTYSRYVKTFFKWLKDEGVIAEDPLANSRVPSLPQRVAKPYSVEQMLAVLDAASSDIGDDAIFATYIDSGVREEELSRIKIGDADLKKGTAKIHGKGNKERYVYLGTDAVEVLEKYIRERRKGASKDDYLFVKDDGAPYTTAGIKSLILRLGKKAGIEERLSSHRLRHSFATLSVKYGATREQIQQEMGHTNAKTTEGYIRVSDDQISAAHRKFSPLSNLKRIRDGGALPESDDAGRNHRFPAPSSPYGQTSPVDTRHKEDILDFAREVNKDISLPWIKDCFVPGLKPGRNNLGKEGFPIFVSENGEIRCGLFEFSFFSTEEGLLLQSFRTQLENGGFKDLLSDISKWVNQVTDHLNRCRELYERVSNETSVSWDRSISIEGVDKPGFTEDSAVLVCSDAIDRLNGGKHFSGYAYKANGYVLRFGGFIVYYGVGTEDTSRFEADHKNLRLKCSKWRQTRTVAEQRQHLKVAAVSIGQQLEKFIEIARYAR